MFSIALDGFWLLGALVAAYVFGVFTAQWAKDKLTGFPPALRAAMKNSEAAALAEITSSRDRIVAETASLLAKGKVAAAAEVKAAVTGSPVVATVAVPVAAAPVAAPVAAPPVA